MSGSINITIKGVRKFAEIMEKRFVFFTGFEFADSYGGSCRRNQWNYNRKGKG